MHFGGNGEQIRRDLLWVELNPLSKGIVEISFACISEGDLVWK